MFFYFQKCKEKFDPARNERHSLVIFLVYGFMARGQCYKPFYCRNLQIFIISQSFCPCKAFLAWSYVCGQGQKPTQEWSIGKVLYSGRFWPYYNHWTGANALTKYKNYSCKSPITLGQIGYDVLPHIAKIWSLKFKLFTIVINNTYANKLVCLWPIATSILV